MNTTFNHRIGLSNTKPFDGELPEETIVALAHLMVNLRDKGYLSSEYASSEMLRSGRLRQSEFEYENDFFLMVEQIFKKMEWWRVFAFLERVYSRLLKPEHEYDERVQDFYEATSLASVRTYYIEEINTIFAEDNIGYYFIDGQFQRRGRSQTQKSFQRMGTVLANPLLLNVRKFYNKAQDDFSEQPHPAVENCINNAMCALEACLEIVSEKPASNHFSRVVKDLMGNGERQIPPPLAEGMIKLHGYRGSGKGVAHAAINGNRVSEIDAELVLNLVASYITYLVDLFPSKNDEIPF